MTPDDPRHGERRGYTAHIKSGVPPCRPCKDAAARDTMARHHERIRGLPSRRVPARGVLRRLQALYALGWTADHISEAGGWSGGHQVTATVRARRGADWVQRITADRMDAAYAALSTKRGPSNLNREMAIRKGWAPPAAWDDIDTDGKPDGLIVTERGCGTWYGAAAHYRAGETPCRPCKDAAAKHARDRAHARGIKPRKKVAA